MQEPHRTINDLLDPVVVDADAVRLTQVVSKLGLPLVRLLTELHGGTVDVTSGGRNHGSRFAVHSVVAAAGSLLSVGAVVYAQLMTLVVAASMLGAGSSHLPNRPDSLKFAVVGDFGTGHSAASEVAAQMHHMRSQFNFEMVVMTGDNVVGDQDDAHNLADKFEIPFKALLETNVRFYASLGNHDRPSNVSYPPFNMGGQRYYTFARQHVRFFMLDSNWLDARQVRWLDEALSRSTDDWKICVFHHPLYSDGKRHGPSLELRVILEPILVRHGVDVVFSGHDHVYERLHPQKGITYFVTGAGGQSERSIAPSVATAAAFDEDRSFVLVEVSDDELHFQTVTRGGATVDMGVIRRQRG